MKHLATTLTLATVAALTSEARADDRPATPADYRTVVTTLRPGDTMRLAAGAYGILSISNLNGTPTAPIIIEGPASGAPAVFNADSGPCCNTIELRNSSYVVLRNVTVDGRHIAGAFGVSAGGLAGNTVHHVTVEGCTFLNHDASQQTVAISTKTPTWGWIIRGNTIRGAGTGLYLGNSDGSQPFIGGLIENNLIVDTVGYGMEIKYQRARPMLAGMPTEPTSTIIRNNVWIKTDRPSPDGNRPNLLVGGFPDTGLGSMDRYEIYGNVFLHNPRESLLQASGRVTIHDNLFIDVVGTAMLLRNHDLPLRQAYVYNNTIYSAGRGVVFGSAATQGSAVVGNVIFSAMPISGTIDTQRDNVTDAVTAASMHVASPSITPGMIDLYPRAGRCQGAAVDLTMFSADRDWDRDFNCTPRTSRTFRGAYSGEGSNPGWRVIVGLKPACATSSPDAGTPDASISDATVDVTVADVSRTDIPTADITTRDVSGADVARPDASTPPPDDLGATSDAPVPSDDATANGSTSDATLPSPGATDSGCGCRMTRGDRPAALAFLAVAACLARRRGRRGERSLR